MESVTQQRETLENFAVIHGLNKKILELAEKNERIQEKLEAVTRERNRLQEEVRCLIRCLNELNENRNDSWK